MGIDLIEGTESYDARVEILIDLQICTNLINRAGEERGVQISIDIR